MDIRRTRQLALRVVAVPLALAALWLVLANGALWLAPRCIDKKAPVAISFTAWTLIPGTVHVRDLNLRAEDRWVQWGLDIDKAKIHIGFSELMKRTIDARDVQADGVSFRLRSKQTAEKYATLPANSFPPISGFDTPPIRDDARFPPLTPLSHPWTLQMGVSRALVDELWVDGTRYDGRALAEGQWEITFGSNVQVDSASLVAEGGSIQQRGVEVAQDVKAELTGELHAFDPTVLLAEAVLAQLDVAGELHAGVPAGMPLTDAFGLERKVSLDSKPGTLDADLLLERGVLREGTRIKALIPSASTQLGAIGVRSDVEADVSVSAAGTLDYALRATGLHASVPRHAGLGVHAALATLQASSPSGELLKLQAPPTATLELHRATLPDLQALNALIPDPVKVEVVGGRAQVTGRLDVNLEKGTAAGAVGLRVSELSGKYEGKRLRGAVDVDLKLRGATLDLDRFQLSGSRIAFREMKLDGNERPWSGSVTLEKTSVNLRRRDIFRGRIAAKFEDARPLFRAVVAELEVPKWSQAMLTPRNVTADFELALGRKLVRVDQLNAKVGRVAMRGYVRVDGTDRRAVSELTLGKNRLGVEAIGKRTDVLTFASGDWFERKRQYAL